MFLANKFESGILSEIKDVYNLAVITDSDRLKQQEDDTSSYADSYSQMSAEDIRAGVISAAMALAKYPPAYIRSLRIAYIGYCADLYITEANRQKTRVGGNFNSVTRVLKLARKDELAVHHELAHAREKTIPDYPALVREWYEVHGGMSYFDQSDNVQDELIKAVRPAGFADSHGRKNLDEDMATVTHTLFTFPNAFSHYQTRDEKLHQKLGLISRSQAMHFGRDGVRWQELVLGGEIPRFYNFGHFTDRSDFTYLRPSTLQSIQTRLKMVVR